MRMLIIAVTMAVSTGGVSVHAGDEATSTLVMLKDGRTVSGRLLPSDSDQTILIENSVRGIRLTTRIPVESVESIRSASESDSSASDHRLAPATSPSPPARRISQARSLPESDTHSAVKSIAVDAWSTNWDADSAADGLRLYLSVQDHEQRLCRVPGQLSVRLMGILQPDQLWPYTDRRSKPVRLLESWTVPVTISSYQDGVAVVDLPYRRFAPQREVDVAPWGGIEVSFSVSSVGVFRAELTDIVLRDVSLFRDDLQMTTGRRTFPGDVNRSFPHRIRSQPLRPQMR